MCTCPSLENKKIQYFLFLFVFKKAPKPVRTRNTWNSSNTCVRANFAFLAKSGCQSLRKAFCHQLVADDFETLILLGWRPRAENTLL